MNGPEHYREAERLLAQVADVVSLNYSTQTGESKADVLAAAQVHATLALASATANPGEHDGPHWSGAYYEDYDLEVQS